LIARPEDVEDVAQEVFLRLYFSLDQLRTAEVFEPWLYRLTVNAAYDYLRKQRRRQEGRRNRMINTTRRFANRWIRSWERSARRTGFC
jgi:RNA polymerase sigma-70 factor (ECF subfamily)